MIGALLGGYIVVGFISGLLGYDTLTYDGPIGPPGSEPAVRFLFGVFWPLLILTVVLLVPVRFAVMIARSFVVLWRHYIGPRLPRATARSKP